MISENIKQIRLASKLNQTEFSREIGISRTSLSRYERGVDVPYQVIEKISQRFGLSYVEILGEDKMMTPNEKYHLTLKKEVVKELGASVLADILRYMNLNQIELSNQENPISKMAFNLSQKINTDIYLMATKEEVESLNGYITGLREIFTHAELVA
jgi:HTH-type transcriptional regulator/antitoxin PezA